MRIAVIGAGIAGLTVALALDRAGLRCRVYEQATRLGPVGAGVQLAPNATRLLHRLGLSDGLRVVAARPVALHRRDWRDGALLSRTELGDNCVTHYGAPYYTLHRADLHRLLADALPPGTLRLGGHCVGTRRDADRVLIGFADGTERPADVVIGADGIHSTVRTEIVRDNPRFTGEAIYRGLVPAGELPFLSGTEITTWQGPRQHCVSYPVFAGRSIAFSATVRTTTAAGGGESWSETGSGDELIAAYADWNESVRRLVGATEPIGRWALHDRDPVAWTGHDRVTLAGDAAHPMLPTLAQGANQAIEDAVVLAGCLREVSGDGVPAALRRYEEIRLPRTAAIQTAARTQGRTRGPTRGRTRAPALAGPDGAHRRNGDAELRDRAWIYGYDAEQALIATASTTDKEARGDRNHREHRDDRDH